MTAALQPSSGRWLPCRKCGATTRHDDGYCYRDTRHRHADPRLGFQHTPETPDFEHRRDAGRLGNPAAIPAEEES